MSSRSLNKAMLIGNVTRDPELRYTPNGTPVCSFGLATNRSWMPEGGTERREETEFHRLVAWNKLAELCSQLITKGRKIYVEGRLQSRSWETPDGEKRSSTEIVIEDMMLLDARPDGSSAVKAREEAPAPEVADELQPASDEGAESKKDTNPVSGEAKPHEIDLDDIPF
jgi:single-strand DNA-binding protein